MRELADHGRGHASLLDLLTLEQIDANLFRATNPPDRSRPTLFGGQVAAQALRAAAATVDPDRVPHSLHGYFLRAGSLDHPTLMIVDRDRDGRSFSARHVNAVQQGEVIFSALASFHVAETGVDHQEQGLDPNAGDPESLPERERVGHGVLLDIRGGTPFDGHGHRAFWVRPRVAVPDDRVVAACIVTYLSDVGWAFGELDVAANHGGPSLDHAVWLQRSIGPNDWVYIDLRPVTLAGARGVFAGTMHDRAGRLVAYFTQEALVRPRSS